MSATKSFARTAVRTAAALTTTLAGTAALALALTAAPASAATQTNCMASPHTCGYPDATNTGVPAGTKLLTVPTQVSSGTGWSYNATDQTVDVTGNGATLSGLYIPDSVSVSADNVTIKDDQIVTSGTYGVALRTTTATTIEDSTISGQDTGSGRVVYAIDDVYGDSTGMTIKDNNISMFRCGVQVSTGLVTGNYIHDPGYVTGDHTNGVIDNGGTAQLTISDNTIFNSLTQTDAITFDDLSGNPVANKTVENNLLAGGDYAIYGGAAFGSTTSNVVIKNNRFGQAYYSTSGQFGPAAYFDPTGTGNTWTGNIWDTDASTVPAP